MTNSTFSDYQIETQFLQLPKVLDDKHQGNLLLSKLPLTLPAKPKQL